MPLTVLSQTGKCDSIKINYAKTIVYAQELECEINKRDTIIVLKDKIIEECKALASAEKKKKRRQRIQSMITSGAVSAVFFFLIGLSI